jgi:chemotaxis signal transduction protein
MSVHVGIPYPTSGRAMEMRAEFDSAFSRPPRHLDTDLIDVLMLRLGAEPCMLRLSDIGQVIVNPVLTPVPTQVPALIGVTVGQGAPVAAYDLGLLLGRAPITPRWLVLAAAEPGVGLAFEHFEGYHRIPLGPDQAQQTIEMPTLIDLITRLAHHRSSNQEIDS